MFQVIEYTNKTETLNNKKIVNLHEKLTADIKRR